MDIKTTDLLDLTHSLAGDYLAGFAYPWQALDGISDLILTLGPTLPKDEYEERESHVWVHKTATVFPSAYLGAPCIIGPNTEVRHCAFIRGSALVGADCVVGNSVELKNVILFDHVQVPHYNYVGDSILGYYSHMGAGSITSNVKSDKTLVTVKVEEGILETGRKKFGAILGDYVEVGCNSVLNPGTVIGRHSSIYPTSCVRGRCPPTPSGRRPPARSWRRWSSRALHTKNVLWPAGQRTFFMEGVTAPPGVPLPRWPSSRWSWRGRRPGRRRWGRCWSGGR